MLQAICFYLYYECNMEDRNFSNVMKLIRCAEVKEDQEDYESTLDIMFEQVKEKNPEHIAVRQYAVFKQAAGKTAKSILVSAAVRLTVFNMQAIEKLTGTDTIDLTSIGDEKTALFCITPVVDTTYNFLVAMLYTQLFESLYFHAETECPDLRLPIHVRFMLDEFANIGTIPEFEQKLATMRKYEISCTIIIQNMAQLKTMYKDSWESITGNCDTFIFLGGKEQATLEYVSKELGKETIVTQTDTRSFGKGGGSSRNKSIIGRELMTPTEIGQMDTMTCIVMIRGLLPFLDQKYDYPKHPNYKYTGDADKKLIYDVSEQFRDKKKPRSRNERVQRDKIRHREVMRTARKYQPDKKDRVRRHNVDGTPLYKPMPVTSETLLQTTGVRDMKEYKDKMSYVEANVSTEDYHTPEGMYEPEMVGAETIIVADDEEKASAVQFHEVNESIHEDKEVLHPKRESSLYNQLSKENAEMVDKSVKFMLQTGMYKEMADKMTESELTDFELDMKEMFAKDFLNKNSDSIDSSKENHSADITENKLTEDSETVTEKEEFTPEMDDEIFIPYEGDEEDADEDSLLLQGDDDFYFPSIDDEEEEDGFFVVEDDIVMSDVSDEDK